MAKAKVDASVHAMFTSGTRPIRCLSDMKNQLTAYEALKNFKHSRTSAFEQVTVEQVLEKVEEYKKYFSRIYLTEASLTMRAIEENKIQYGSISSEVIGESEKESVESRIRSKGSYSRRLRIRIDS
jgi:hypothetical protein